MGAGRSQDQHVFPFREEHLVSLLAPPGGQFAPGICWGCVLATSTTSCPSLSVLLTNASSFVSVKERFRWTCWSAVEGREGASARFQPWRSPEREKERCPQASLAPGLLVRWAGPGRRGPRKLSPGRGPPTWKTGSSGQTHSPRNQAAVDGRGGQVRAWEASLGLRGLREALGPAAEVQPGNVVWKMPIKSSLNHWQITGCCSGSHGPIPFPTAPGP